MTALRFDTDGADWPHREASRFVRQLGMSWHVQVMGTGPALLLLHGTGASTHSWSGLASLLSPHHTLVMPDLPGHGFSQRPDRSRMSLAGMSALLSNLLQTLGIDPVAAIGHSAGAAILMRMVLDRRIAPASIVSLNGALTPLPSRARHLFPLVATLATATPALPWLVARQAERRANVDRLLGQTGSSIPEDSARRYATLLSRSSHVEGALAMMSRWRLETLSLEQIETPTLLVVGDRDRMVPPADAIATAARLPHARIETLHGLGHLAHEERPDLVAELVLRETAATSRQAAEAQPLCA